MKCITGIALQMLTYLDIVITHSETINWHGSIRQLVYYISISIIQSLIAIKLLTMDDIEKEILKKFKMKGLITWRS